MLQFWPQGDELLRNAMTAVQIFMPHTRSIARLVTGSADPVAVQIAVTTQFTSCDFNLRPSHARAFGPILRATFRSSARQYGCLIPKREATAAR